MRANLMFMRKRQVVTFVACALQCAAWSSVSIAQESAPQQILFKTQLYELPPAALAAVREAGFDFARALPQQSDEDDSAEQAFKPIQLTAEQTLRLRDQLKSLRKKSQVKLLAEPNLVTMLGREAWFRAGGEIPVQTKDAQGQPTLTFKHFGTSLKLHPTELDEGKLTLKVDASVSELKPDILNKRAKLPAAEQAKLQDDPIRVLFSSQQELEVATGQSIALLLPTRKADDMPERNRGFPLIIITTSLVTAEELGKK